MKKIWIVLVVSLITLSANAQKLKGQWRGYFNSNGDIVLTDDDYSNTEYVLELELNNTTVTGFSYSYFQGRKYYVICSLKGTYNKKDKLITVTETDRIKGFTPPGWEDCLQTHILTYKKEGTTEILSGKWKPANTNVSNCGVGMTTLTRKTLKTNLATYNKSQTRTPVAAIKKPANKLPNLADKNKTTPPVASKKNTTKLPVPTAPAKQEKVEPITKSDPDIAKKETPIAEKEDITGFEKRDNNVIKTITVENENFKVSLYDNGDIDGDIISLFYNGKLLLAHKRLSDKPLTLTLDATTDKDINELIMYAENLGDIPPNTALMVVNDGDKRYEIRIASDLQKSGSIRFVHKSKTPQ